MMEPMDLLVARRIRQEREAAGLPQSALAKVVGVSIAQIAKYEGGSDRVTAGALYLIANRLGVKPDDLFRAVPPLGPPALRFVRAARQMPQRMIKPLGVLVAAVNGSAK